jgi:SAM-dependent methyltransferase
VPGVATTDWGAGRYEHTAEQLLPAAFAAVGAAGIEPGERVLDIGCGTGNAALLASQHGGEVLGIDPSERLLEVARREADARGLDTLFDLGDAAHVPVPDASADAVLSVFGVIFAPDAAAAVREIARVSGPEGRAVLTAWVPDGLIFEAMRLRAQAVAEVEGSEPAPSPFAWHDPAALGELFAPHGFSVKADEKRLQFEAGSAEEWLDGEIATSPLWLTARAVLEPAGEMAGARERVLELLQSADEAGEGFRASSSYAVITAQRGY